LSFGFRFSGFGFGLSGIRFRAHLDTHAPPLRRAASLGSRFLVFFFRVPDSGFRVSGFGYTARRKPPPSGAPLPGSGFGVPGSGFRISVFEVRALTARRAPPPCGAQPLSGSGFLVPDSEFRFSCFGYQVSGFGYTARRGPPPSGVQPRVSRALPRSALRTALVPAPDPGSYGNGPRKPCKISDGWMSSSRLKGLLEPVSRVIKKKKRVEYGRLPRSALRTALVPVS
jgi:hypothetical protein